MRLTELPIGKKAEITELTTRGKKRRRLLDLGLIPGTYIVTKRRSPSGNPSAYLFRGTIIALRSEVTDSIYVKMLD